VGVLVALVLVVVVWQLASPGGHRPALGEVYVFHNPSSGYYGQRVLGVSGKTVDYELFACDGEGQPLPGSRPPQPSTWRPDNENDVPPGREIGREWLVISGVRFDCAILREPKGSRPTKSWEARLRGRKSFPGTLRYESEGKLGFELVKVVLPR
jgi:hypothetical protein